MSITLRFIGAFGIFLFGTLLSMTFLSPEKVEESAKGFVMFQVAKEVREKQQALNESSAAKTALKIAETLGLEKKEIQSKLESDLPEKIASVIASMCGYDCEKKKSIAHSVTSTYMERKKSIGVAEQTLGGIIKGKYLEIVGNLKLDLRIFLGSNLAIFIVLLVVSFIKPQALAHLFLPGLLLVVATVLSSSIYIFGQDWFYTILYNDYMGFGYLAYIAAIFGLMFDICFNQGRVTTQIINGIANVVGSAVSVMPC
ncbi:Uncharacterised protein [BD1-7 clade bacterium]|uniref:Uncharacterized protein n=1 Tax=BD1-7 clade bacterium TaxID=2029982 RepID=A0A5S9Q8K8_9GAMM|nr:Uncharacterised protein [BD1-7 clade bacterium]